MSEVRRRCYFLVCPDSLRKGQEQYRVCLILSYLLRREQELPQGSFWSSKEALFADFPFLEESLDEEPDDFDRELEAERLRAFANWLHIASLCMRLNAKGAVLMHVCALLSEGAGYSYTPGGGAKLGTKRRNLLIKLIGNIPATRRHRRSGTVSSQTGGKMNGLGRGSVPESFLPEGGNRRRRRRRRREEEIYSPRSSSPSSEELEGHLSPTSSSYLSEDAFSFNSSPGRRQEWRQPDSFGDQESEEDFILSTPLPRRRSGSRDLSFLRFLTPDSFREENRSLVYGLYDNGHWEDWDESMA